MVKRILKLLINWLVTWFNKRVKILENHKYCSRLLKLNCFIKYTIKAKLLDDFHQNWEKELEMNVFIFYVYILLSQYQVKFAKFALTTYITVVTKDKAKFDTGYINRRSEY